MKITISSKQEYLTQRLFNWLMRKTTNTSVRRVAELPMAIATDIGLVRSENQDRSVVLRMQLTENRPLIIVILCDGMGGMDAGSECASLAIASFLSSCVHNFDYPLQERILASVINANDVIFKKYNGNGGSTLSALVADGENGVLAVNVGDSRIYSMENGLLSQLTIDDTIAGQFAFKDKNLYRRNELLQYVGMGQEIEPHIISFSNEKLLSNILLTSDGTHFLDEHTMASIIKHSTDRAIAARRLIELAKWCGGHDNASVIIATDILSSLTPTFDPQVIEIWDAFGEIQIVNAYSPTAQQSKSVVRNTNPKQTNKQNRKQNSTDKENKPKAIGRKKAKDTSISPELKINFELLGEG